MDLSYNRPGSSWPDKLHSWWPFPPLGKKVCILFSPTTVTNTSRGVMKPSSLWTTLKPKTTPRNVYILHPCFLNFYLHNLGHTWESATKEGAGLQIFTTNDEALGVLFQMDMSAKTTESLLFMISQFFYLGMVWPRRCFQLIQCKADRQHDEFSKLNSLQLPSFRKRLAESADNKLLQTIKYIFRVKKPHMGGESRHVSPVLVRNVTKWWILRSCWRTATGNELWHKSYGPWGPCCILGNYGIEKRNDPCHSHENPTLS